MTYTSSFSRPLEPAEIHQIGSHSARRNAQEGITGVLLTLGSVFFQVIEGDDAAIDDLYRRVLSDDRHTNIICLRTEADATHRLFPDWSMNVFELDRIGGDVVEPLKLMLAHMSQAQQIIERYTQPAVSRLMAQGLNPLEVPLRNADRLVLFADMVAFSAISERLAMSDVSDLVSTYLETCSTGIARAGGEVTKFLGDGVMAYFDPERADQALQSCVDIQTELRQIREAAPSGSPHQLLYSGFGLAVGPVIEGSIGSSIKMDYTIIGQPVNVAAKLEELTRSRNAPILMTQAVVEATSERWTVASAGTLDTGAEVPTAVFSLETDGGERDMKAAVMDRLDAMPTRATA